jgi:glucose/arabinose dehydrogenase
MALAGLAGAGCASGQRAESKPPGNGSGKRGTVRLEKVGDFQRPLYVAQPPGEEDLLFVVQKAGQVRVLERGETKTEPFLDLRDRVGSGGVEQGLLSLAFAPDFARSRLLYVSFTDKRDDLEVVEFRASLANPLEVDPSKSRRLLSIHQPAPIHNGGHLVFGPGGHLYIGVGDGGPSHDPYRTAQSKNSFLGKILRIDPRRDGDHPYTVPRSNPFVGRDGWDEVYAYGLRNPWRFSFDRKTGDLLIGDVGQDFYEEIDFRRARRAAGSNFGWSAFEGKRVENPDQRRRARRRVRPILVYSHVPRCSVTGGYVVRDTSLRPLLGRYVYGDFCSGKIRSLLPSAHRARDDKLLGLQVPALASFAEDNAGHIYAVSLNGPVYRLLPR